MKFYSSIINTISYSILLLLVITCGRKETPETPSQNTNQAIEKRINTNTFKVTKTSEKILKKKGYKNNLEVIKKESYFDSKDAFITIKTPVTNINFKHFKTYDISPSINDKAILYVIYDDAETAVLNQTMSHITNHKISFSSIDSVFKLSKGEKLKIVVFNDNFTKYSAELQKALVKELKEMYAVNGTIDCDDYSEKILDKLSDKGIDKSQFLPEPKEACGGIILD